MARVRGRRGQARDSAKEVLAAITQTQYMVDVYVEILAMDQIIIERVRKILINEAAGGDVEAHVSNLQLLLSQLERIGERIAYWNARTFNEFKKALGG